MFDGNAATAGPTTAADLVAPSFWHHGPSHVLPPACRDSEAPVCSAPWDPDDNKCLKSRWIIFPNLLGSDLVALQPVVCPAATFTFQLCF